MKTPNSQSIHDRPRGQFSLGVQVLVGSALKVRFPSFSSSSGVPHRTLFYLKGYSSRFTRQLLIDDWVFKEDFPRDETLVEWSLTTKPFPYAA
ncbi:MAG: hypothetical protein F6J94_28880 [Moorea sp. SIO1F2]|uniref:hypothetical protein n=1 Tax=unclassified Moorena TaxID=2683338 RepID=UPI0013BBF643|nr:MULTISPECIES: hypothetical protein [unclassified Moorena]NET85760.1 hypothetical protein [Moorena sp. SIO1F2]